MKKPRTRFPPLAHAKTPQAAAEVSEAVFGSASLRMDSLKKAEQKYTSTDPS